MTALHLLLLAAFADEPPPAAPVDEEVLVQIDWQGHPAMHLTWKFFGKGLVDRAPRRSWRHQFRQVAYEPYLEESGVRIHLMAAMAAEKARNPDQAKRMILRELAYVEQFVAENSEEWALARTPAEARAILRDTDKRVVIHAIEGGHLLLSGPEDAKFWREQGVALVTVLHLRDDELGGAALLDMAVGPLINPAGARAKRREERRGLTERGKAAIVELHEAGILVDLSHMSPETVDDALAVTGANGIPPVVTHGKLRSITANEFGFRDDQVLSVYRQGGVFSLGLSPQLLDPVAPTLAIPPDVCPSTVEMFAFHYDAVNRLLLANASELVGAAGELTPDQRTRLAVGWSSDWNGWVVHGEPAYGRGACRPLSDLDDPLPVDTEGLAHPGLLPSHWERMQREGADLEPMLRSAERFLQLWEQVQTAADAGEPAP
jgi:microsomal dipeptidase-like Zn-dependent dipeptidase